MKDEYPIVTEVSGGKLKRVWRLNSRHRYVDHLSGLAITYLLRSQITSQPYWFVEDGDGKPINKKTYTDLRAAATAAEKYLIKKGLLK